MIAISRIFDEYECLHPFVSQQLYNIGVHLVSDIKPPVTKLSIATGTAIYKFTIVLIDVLDNCKLKTSRLRLAILYIRYNTAIILI